MKKLLIGTTALVAFGFAGSAFAAKAELGVGGWVHTGVAFADMSDFSTDGDKIHVIRESEIHFNGKITADNGLTFAAKVELEGISAGSDQIDENFASVSGSFGSIMIGGNDSASVNVGHAGVGYVANSNYMYGLIPGFVPANGKFGFAGDGDSMGLHYTTPSLMGFKLGASFAPDHVGGSSDGANDGQHTGGKSGGYRYAIGASYGTDVGGAKLGLGAGYTKDQGAADATWHVGADIGFSGVGLHLIYQDIGATEDIGVGLDYTTGPWKIGGGIAMNSDNDDKHATVGATYTLAPGAKLSGVVEYGDDGANDGFAVIGLMSLNF